MKRKLLISNRSVNLRKLFQLERGYLVEVYHYSYRLNRLVKKPKKLYLGLFSEALKAVQYEN